MIFVVQILQWCWCRWICVCMCVLSSADELICLSTSHHFVSHEEFIHIQCEWYLWFGSFTQNTKDLSNSNKPSCSSHCVGELLPNTVFHMALNGCHSIRTCNHSFKLTFLSLHFPCLCRSPLVHQPAKHTHISWWMFSEHLYYAYIL